MQEKDWNPEETFVCILGLDLDTWADPDDPEWNRIYTFQKIFLEAGVPEEQILMLEDEEGYPAKVRESLPELLQKTTENSLFIFIYAGHGGIYEEKFYFCHPVEKVDATYGTELFDMIEANFNGSQVILFIDCCYSGSIANIAKERNSNISYGVVSSATSDIESTGSWAFCDCVITAFNGKAKLDTDEDGTVSFQELCDYVIKTMDEEANQPADFTCTSDFDGSFRLAVSSD